MNSKYVGIIIWSILLLLFVALHVQIFSNFNGYYVDGDQTISWLSAVDKSNGKWYTSYFYGQFYNISLEAIFSAPFIAMGFPVKSVVPLISSFIGAIPFVLGTLLFIKKQRYDIAILVLSLALILPVEYHFMVVLSRGFSGGLALLSIGIFLNSFKNRISQFVGLFFVFFSYFVNPNVLIILIPIAMYEVLQHVIDKKKIDLKYYLIMLVALVSSIGLLVVINLQNHENYAVHHLWDIALGWEYFIENIQTIDSRFSDTFPFLKNHGSLYLVLFFGAGMFFFYKKKSKSWLLVIGILLFLLLTLAVNKTTDGTLSTFYPYSRMYLALPFLLVLIYYSYFERTSEKINKLLVIGAIGLVGSINTITSVPEAAKESVRKNSGVVQVLPIERLCKTCNDIENLQRKYNADLIVYYYKTDEYLYGCNALNQDFKAIYPEYDRRHWTFSDLGTKTFPTVLFLDWSLTFDEKLTNYNGKLTMLEGVNFPAYLLTENNQSVVELFKLNNLTVRPYTKE